MKVLLINPPDNYPISANIPEYASDKHLPPLGLLYIASYLAAKSNHSVKIYDAILHSATYNQIAEEALAYDVIGITTITFQLIDVIETVKAIRKINKMVAIILGGPHLAVYPKETIRIPGVTYCLVGECDKTFTQLVNMLSEGKTNYHTIPVLYWNQDGEIHSNPADEFIQDLDQLPIPNRHLLEYEMYNSIFSHLDSKSHLVTTMFSSRGCPYKCIFCDRPNLGKSFRYHSSKRVVEEIEYCIELGIAEILFYDDTFNVVGERVTDICELILQKNLDIKWDIRARVNNVSYDVLKLMHRAGCRRIHFGVESGNEEILKVMKKGITRKLAREAFGNARKLGIETTGYFMFGCPNETLPQIQETLDFALELNPDYAHFSILTPFPGTPIYMDALKQGLFEKDYWREFSESPSPDFVPFFLPNTLPREQLIVILNRAYKTFYIRPKYLFRQAIRVASWNDFYRKAIIAKRIICEAAI